MNFSALLSAAPSALPIILVLLVGAYFFRGQLQTDRRVKAEHQRYTEEIARLTAAHAAELLRVTTQSEARYSALQAEVIGLRADVARLEESLDKETERRRKAEEDAHQARMTGKP